MPGIQKSLRIRERVVAAIEEIAAERESDFSTVANELLDGATRMVRCPGVVFVHGPSGPRARVAGTGIDVWEVIATYKCLRRNSTRLRKAYPQLGEAHLGAALNYYRLYREEIDRQVARNAAWTPHKVREKYPFMAGEAE